jgi:hypothetical protein
VKSHSQMKDFLNKKAGFFWVALYHSYYYLRQKMI